MRWRGRALGYLLSLVEGDGQPVQTFVQAVASGGAAGLDVPLSVSEAVQTQLVGHLGGTHGVGQILLVGEDQEDGLTQLVLVQHAVHLVTGCSKRNRIRIVTEKDQCTTIEI